MPSAVATGEADKPTEVLAPIGKVYDDTVRSVEVLVGERFTIRLPANISTPYKWAIERMTIDPPPVVLAERHYHDRSPPDCPACVGYPGTDVLTFEARVIGKASLTIRYAPIRETTEPPERELVIQVTVKER